MYIRTFNILTSTGNPEHYIPQLLDIPGLGSQKSNSQHTKYYINH